MGSWLAQLSLPFPGFIAIALHAVQHQAFVTFFCGKKSNQKKPSESYYSGFLSYLDVAVALL